MKQNDGTHTSRYSLKYAQRRKRDNGAENPMPAPFDHGYFRTYQPVFQFPALAFSEPFKHENGSMVRRFRDSEFRYPAKKLKDIPIRKFDHYKLNWAGCPRFPNA